MLGIDQQLAVLDVNIPLRERSLIYAFLESTGVLNFPKKGFDEMHAPEVPSGRQCGF